MLVILQALPILATNVLTSQYLTPECSGPPAVMYNFYTADIWAVEQPENETWPFGYTAVWNYDYVFDFCGCTIICSYLKDKELPCHNALDDRFLPYSSLSFIQLENEIANVLPPGTENAKYCYLQSKGSGALLGMNETFLLTAGNCIDDTYQCFENGTLLAFSDHGCTGSIETFTLSSKPTVFNSSVLGEFSASLFTVSSEKSPYRYVWNSWLPVDLLMPYYKIAWEIFAMICFVIALILLLYWLCEVSYRIYKNRQNRKLFNLNELLCYMIRIICTICELLYWAESWDDTGIRILFTILKGFGAFGSLLQILFCTEIFLFEVHRIKAWQKNAIIIALLGIHIGLAGSNYIAYYRNWNIDAVKELFYSWREVAIYWDIFAQIYVNLLPLLIIHQLLVLNYKKLPLIQRFQILMQIDKWLVYCIIAQVCIQILKAISQQLRFSVVYGDDRVLLAAYGHEALFSALLTWLVIRIANGIRSVARQKSRHSSSITSK